MEKKNSLFYILLRMYKYWKDMAPDDRVQKKSFICFYNLTK